MTAGSAGFRFQASQGRRIEPLPAVAWVVSVYRSPASLEAQPPLPLKEWIDRLFWCVLSALSLSCQESKRRDVSVLCVGKSPTLAQSIAGESRFASMCLPERRARRVRWLEGPACRVRCLEGPACRVRCATFDNPSRFIGHDKRAPPSGHDKHGPPTFPSELNIVSRPGFYPPRCGGNTSSVSSSHCLGRTEKALLDTHGVVTYVLAGGAAEESLWRFARSRISGN